MIAFHDSLIIPRSGRTHPHGYGLGGLIDLRHGSGKEIYALFAG